MVFVRTRRHGDHTPGDHGARGLVHSRSATIARSQRHRPLSWPRIIPAHSRAAALAAARCAKRRARRSRRRALADTRGRPLRDLRISVTDRCNFRCIYCMPKDVFGRDYPFLPHAELLTFEEIARLARIFVGARRREDPPDRRRAAAAPATSSAWSTMLRRRRRPRPHADHQRRAARARRRAPESRRPDPRHASASTRSTTRRSAR